MKRTVGTISRGIRCPIIREGDDLASIVTDSILKASKQEGFEIEDKDIIGMTESIVARAQGNYTTIDAIAKDIKQKFNDDTIGVVFPILSRNRFSTILQGIARGAKKLVLLIQYPSDEVGNALLTFEQLDASGVNPYSDTLTYEAFRKHFPITKHPFTNLDYIQLYKDIVESEGCELELVFSNNPTAIMDYTTSVLACDVHHYKRTSESLKQAGVKKLYGLEHMISEPIDDLGYNKEYGLLGANKATEETVKLFPRDNFAFVEKVQKMMFEKTGKTVEVMVYGDGAFKDPVGQIWELADPTVAPGFTKGLEGTPSEIKLKYLADNDFQDLSGAELDEALAQEIKGKEEHLDDRLSQGTTPRRIVDLVGSLCDLTSGSGDKGTPIVYIQGYFDNFSD
ncbi:MAG TPA: coenzyme F420-0:L-glutamate ligase [Erysipelothrix sp.]|nr:coenzyme F420-0:L-glutamate ligase [Erysipelothrix sp.]